MANFVNTNPFASNPIYLDEPVNINSLLIGKEYYLKTIIAKGQPLLKVIIRAIKQEGQILEIEITVTAEETFAGSGKFNSGEKEEGVVLAHQSEFYRIPGNNYSLPMNQNAGRRSRRSKRAKRAKRARKTRVSKHRSGK
jgi:hypothetical protein